MLKKTIMVVGFLGAVALAAPQDVATQPDEDAARPAGLLFPLRPLDRLPEVKLPQIDRQLVSREDQQRAAAGLAPRYAIPTRTHITPDTHGVWEDTGDGRRVWRMRISAPGAVSLNLGFTRYFMPPGGQLLIYSADLSQVIRPFTSRDNATHGELWTPVVVGDEIVVELRLPADANGLQLELTSIGQGYRGFGAAVARSAVLSGSCNVDVVCPEGDGWRDEISAVAVISTGGGLFCTGFMVNNTASDLTPYFMTANHCGIGPGNAASLVVYWNYENSTCRPPNSPASGGPGDGSLSQFQTGAFFRAGGSASDFTLVELDQDPDPAWNVGYAGWSRSSADGTSAVGIHHPNTDEKRISFENAPTQTTSYLGSASPGDGTHVRVIDWDVGTTEPGSSGSPLFDQNHRIVGQLHGGFAACGNNDSDWYGRFSVSWNGGGTPSSRLRDWLDAAGTGAMTVDFVSLATLCSTAGVVELDRPRYACEISARITVVDCDLNRNGGAIDTVTVDVLSDSEPSGETVVLQETGVGTARFEGTIALSATDAAGVLAVAEGDQILVAYVDADDGAGGINVVVTGTAVADCTPPIISNVQATNLQPRSATVTFTSNELVRGTVRYGLSCGALTQSATGTDFSPGPSVDLAVLDGTTYFFAVEAEDEAGNVAGDDNGGLCYTFTTPDVPDYFTQQFNGDLNLDNTSILFTPDASADRYAACREPVTALPIDPAGGTILSLGDDESALVTVSGREPVWLYGVTYRSFFVNSNGNITFGSGDTTWDESLSSHFDRPRLSPLFDDFDPSSGGIISWRQLADRVAVTWQNVPEFSSTNANTFQVELFFDGSLRFSYLTLDSADGITGLSEGNGVPPGFLVSDLSVFGACQIQDCNGNGVPDEQELDCQPNGVPDDCDIAAGTSADCNLNAVPDSCDIAAATLPDVNGNGVPDMCECPPAVPQPEVVSIAKNRYLSLSPGNVQQQTALRVTFVDLPPPFAALNGSTAWVGAPEPVSENGGSIAPIAGFADFNAATLSCTPVFLDWAAVGTVHVWHRAIIPGGVYAVQAIDDACDLGVETNFSPALNLAQSVWGDLTGAFDSGSNTWSAPDGIVGVTSDVIAVVDKFAGRTTAPIKARADIEPATPDQLINISDATRALDAFRGRSYPFDPGPPPCP